MIQTWKVYKCLRHPLVVLVLGAIVGNWLVPWINTRLTEERLRQEARSKTTAEIIQCASAVDIAFNKVYNTLESFHDDNITMLKNLDAAKRKERQDFIRGRQRELRNNMQQRYDEFDAKAWWWYREVEKRAAFLGIASTKEMEDLEKLTKEYDSNLVQAAEAYKDLAHTYLSPEYDASDSRYKELISTHRKQYIELYVARQKLVVNMAKIFACPPSRPCMVEPSIGPTPQR
jgi:lipopolysaccharide export LptBFGC system permease protein LptF